MMRLIVALLLIHMTAADITAEDFVRFEVARRKCSAEHQFNQELLSEALQGKLVNDREFDCFGACVFEDLGLWNPDNSLKTDVIISKVPQDAEFAKSLIEIIQKCSTERDDDKCTAAHSQFACIVESGAPSLVLG